MADRTTDPGQGFTDGLRFDVTTQIDGNHLRVVMDRLRAEFPALDIGVVIDPRVHGINLKVSTLINLLPHDRYRHVIIALTDFDPAFVQRFRARWNELPNSTSTLGYEAALLLFDFVVDRTAGYLAGGATLVFLGVIWLVVPLLEARKAHGSDDPLMARQAMDLRQQIPNVGVMGVTFDMLHQHRFTLRITSGFHEYFR